MHLSFVVALKQLPLSINVGPEIDWLLPQVKLTAGSKAMKEVEENISHRYREVPM